MTEPNASAIAPKSNIHRVFHDPGYIGFRRWHQLVNFFIYLSCILIALESIEDVGAAYARQFTIMEWISVAIFTLDYLGNIYTARDRIAYILSFWGLVDLLSIMPSYLMLFNFTGIKATKILRILRVIRVLRVLKLARAAVDGISASRSGGSNPLIANLRIYVIALFSIMMISSTLMYYVEGSLYSSEAIAEGQAALDHQLTAAGKDPGAEKFVPVDPIAGTPITADKQFFTSIPTAMWWCITTLTTTGYGDLYPVTVGGRIIAGATMLLGLVLFGILMNIVGRTLMVVLFGETHEGGAIPHEADQTAETALRRSIFLLAAEDIIPAERAHELAKLPIAEIGRRLAG